MGETQLGRGEPIEDVARVVTRMVDIVMIRTFEHANIERFASQSRVPVVNGLTNDYHPCQVLADIYTYIEHRGPITGATVAWIGDGNNMCNTWIQAARIFDFKLNVATPAAYGVEPARAAGVGREHLEIFTNPAQAASGAHLVNTDVWTSMGFEAEAAAREAAFRGSSRPPRHGGGAARCALHALPAGAPRRGGRGRCPRRAAKRGVGGGGEPPARAEGAHGVPPARPRRGMRRVLNVGGGSKDIAIPAHYEGWEHVLLDVDARQKPDVVCDARNLASLPGELYDAVYCSHNLEHYWRHDHPRRRGFRQVLHAHGLRGRRPDLKTVFADMRAAAGHRRRPLRPGRGTHT